jgi:uncharacterized membrane protein YcaP (DUF421 family)
MGGKQMNLDWLWQTVILFVLGRFILRFGGRKSVAQLTVTQTIAMIGLGTILVHPITTSNIVITLLIILTLVLLMIIFEYLETKFDFLETLFVGKAIIVIENGKPNIENLKKLRMSLDSLEERLRPGEPATKGDIDLLISEFKNIKSTTITDSAIKKDKSKNNIFKEIRNKTFEGSKNEP